MPPRVLGAIHTASGAIQLLEWDWPGGIESTTVETDLMAELSLLATPALATAIFPTIAPGVETGMGALFIRYPGIAIQTQSQAGAVRLLRCTFSRERREEILAGRHAPSLAMMRTLVAIRDETMHTLMRQCLREVEHQHPGSEQAGEALLRLVAIEVARLLDRDPAPRAGGRLAPWQFKRINDRLAAAEQRPSVPELAALCGISVRHLHRQFQNLTGITISDHIENHLIARAKQMLVGSSASIKAIALANGFDHANSFSRTFRRATGITPLQYRQRRRMAGNGEDRADSAKSRTNA